MNIPYEAVEVHFPEPKPCGDYRCDKDHDGPCWTCGEYWPCTNEKKRLEEQSMNQKPEVSAEAVQELISTPGVVIGAGGRLMIEWEDDEA